eukprot:989721-Pyramimonas_sp.AAC.1
MSGDRWWSHADRNECGSCGRPKGFTFFGPAEGPAGSAPSVSAKHKVGLERAAAAEAERATKSALQRKSRDFAELKELLAARQW